MAVRLVGANPGLTLFDGDERTAVASVWRVDWSAYGTGRVLILLHANRLRVLSDQPELAGWLVDSFVRHFPEVAGLPWPQPQIEQAAVDLKIDLTAGCHATAGDVTLDITEPLDHRTMRVDHFALGEQDMALSNVFVPCGAGTIDIAGTPVTGTPSIDTQRPTSTAFLAEAEVWSDAEQESA